MTINKHTSERMAAAIRIGCNAANVHLTCSYPNCTCAAIPDAIKAAVEFAIVDVSKAIVTDFRLHLEEEARRGT